MDEARRRILVVEDDSLVRQIIVDMLNISDYDLIEAASGHEALLLIDKRDSVYLLITDLNMPGMDGVELATKCAVFILKSRFSSSARGSTFFRRGLLQSRIDIFRNRFDCAS